MVVILELDGREDLELLRLFLVGKRIPPGGRLLIELEEGSPAQEYPGKEVYRFKAKRQEPEMPGEFLI